MGHINTPLADKAATSPIKLEDTVSASGDAGMVTLHVSNETFTNLASDGDYVVPGTTRKGVTLATLFADGNISGVAGVAVREEDSAFPAGGGVVMAGVVNNRNFGAFNSTNGDVLPIMAGDKGVAGTMLMYDSSLGGASSPLVLEDDAFQSAGALVMAGAVNNRGITAFNATQGDATPLAVDDYGRNVNIPFAPINNYVYGNIAPITATNTQLVAAQGGSIRTYVTNLSISNTGATTSLITITDGSGGAVLWYTIAPAGSGSNIQFTVPLRTTANTALYVTTGSASTTMYISMSGFTAV